jgi:hypothetical protein
MTVAKAFLKEDDVVATDGMGTKEHIHGDRELEASAQVIHSGAGLRSVPQSALIYKGIELDATA